MSDDAVFVDSNGRLNEIGISESVEESKARAIEYLSKADRIKMLSVLGNRDKQRLQLMYSVGEELKMDWLIRLADNELQLNVSLKGRGRADITAIVQSPDEKKAGIADRIKSFIRSEG